MQELIFEPDPAHVVFKPSQFPVFRWLGVDGVTVHGLRDPDVTFPGRVKIGCLETLRIKELAVCQGKNLFLCELNEEELGKPPLRVLDHGA